MKVICLDFNLLFKIEAQKGQSNRLLFHFRSVYFSPTDSHIRSGYENSPEYTNIVINKLPENKTKNTYKRKDKTKQTKT